MRKDDGMDLAGKLVVFVALPIAVGITANLLTPVVKRRLDRRVARLASSRRPTREQEEAVISELAGDGDRLFAYVVQQALIIGCLIFGLLSVIVLLVVLGELLDGPRWAAWARACRAAALYVGVAASALAFGLLRNTLRITERVRVRRHDRLIAILVPPETDPRRRHPPSQSGSTTAS
jgi:hypothetical protein